MNRNSLFQIKRELFDYFKWEDIQRKYEMKYLNRYGEIEEDFINDLLKYKIISVKYDDIIYYKYNEILNNIEIKSQDIVLLRTFCKYIYDKDIIDNSEYGKTSDKVLWE